MARKTSSDKENDMTDEELKEITEWPAGLTHEVMENIESKCQEPAHGVNRRILLATLTMDSEKLFKACKDEPETMFEALKCSASTIAMYKRLLNLMDTAHTRLMVALCDIDSEAPDAPFSQEEFLAVIQEAKVEDLSEQGGAS